MMTEWNTALDNFAACAGKLNALVEKLSGEDLDHSGETDSWSIRQIVHHLADSALIWSMFFHQALGDSGGECNLGWYWSKSQDEWGKIWMYADRDIKSSLLLYQANNEVILDLLRSVNNPRENFLLFNYPAQEPQTITVEGAVNWQAMHLDEHLDEIQYILKLHQGS